MEKLMRYHIFRIPVGYFTRILVHKLTKQCCCCILHCPRYIIAHHHLVVLIPRIRYTCSLREIFYHFWRMVKHQFGIWRKFRLYIIIHFLILPVVFNNAELTYRQHHRIRLYRHIHLPYICAQAVLFFDLFYHSAIAQRGHAIRYGKLHLCGETRIGLINSYHPVRVRF